MDAHLSGVASLTGGVTGHDAAGRDDGIWPPKFVLSAAKLMLVARSPWSRRMNRCLMKVMVVSREIHLGAVLVVGGVAGRWDTPPGQGGCGKL